MVVKVSDNDRYFKWVNNDLISNSVKKIQFKIILQ